MRLFLYLIHLYYICMKVLGIDPGYDRLGVAVIEKENNKETLVFSDCILTDKTDELSERIQTAGLTFTSLLETYQPEAVALETIFFNKNAKTAIGVAQMRGVLIYLAKQAGCTVYEYGPQEIKVAITGYGKSDKHAVITMVQKLVSNAPLTALDDEYDAIAVAVTCLAHYRSV